VDHRSLHPLQHVLDLVAENLVDLFSLLITHYPTNYNPKGPGTEHVRKLLTGDCRSGLLSAASLVVSWPDHRLIAVLVVVSRRAPPLGSTNCIVYRGRRLIVHDDHLLIDDMHIYDLAGGRTDIYNINATHNRTLSLTDIKLQRERGDELTNPCNASASLAMWCIRAGASKLCY
jgi:hypothetical protein